MQDVQDEEVCVSTLLYREQLSLILAILAILAILFRFLHYRDQRSLLIGTRGPSYRAGLIRFCACIHIRFEQSPELFPSVVQARTHCALGTVEDCGYLGVG